MNKQRLELIGRVVAKPEIQKSKDDKEYSRFSVAVNRKSKDKEGKEKEEATFYNVLTFDRKAQLSEKLDKGNLVRIVGDLEAKAYLSKKGEAKNDLTVFCRELHVFDVEAFK